ncbi:MAG TPA: DnaJ domain-containing protein [Polyangiaceae bacterium]|jgi:tetratricopeptide (TPR) repeat protein|nr:DnaJ domain-containing protein [Polyangiaceae bacterium]
MATLGEFSTHRPAPAASGTLAKTPFLHLLVYALEKKLGGTIEVVTPDRRSVAVLFVAGEPAKARPSEPVSHLGQVFVELGYLTPELHDTTLAELEDMRLNQQVLHGEFLVRKGLIDAVRLEAALREQLARRLRYVAGLPAETTYAYYDGYDALQGWGKDPARGVDPLPMFWGVLREAVPRTHVDAALAKVSTSSLRIAKTANLMRLGLEPSERAAVDLLRVRPLMVAEFPRVSGLHDHEARLLTYLLLVTKQVDVLSSSHASRISMSGPPSGASTSGPASGASTGGPASGASSAPPQGYVPPRSAPPGRASSPRTPVPPSPRTALVKSLYPPGHVSRSKPPPGMASDLSERWTAIVERARNIDRADYFSMLDLARDSTPEEAETSFYALVKKWHPDRLPAELVPVREHCSRVFSRMSEAHATLTDPEKRTRYMRLHADGSGSPEMQETVAKVVEAASDFQKAEVCFKRNDLVQAEALCRKALKADATQPDYHALLAWLVSIKRENQTPEKLIECIQMLDRAVSMSDRCERAFFWRGMLNKRIGKPETAYRDFRKAVDLNPHNIDAAREIRLHNMRGGPRTKSSSPPAATTKSSPVPGKPAKPDEKGLLGRFFKK